MFVLLSVVVGFTCLLSFLNFCRRIQKDKNLIPPGSMGWPLFGQTLAFLKPHTSNSIGIFLQQHIFKYGRIFKSHLFGSPAIVSCDQELNMFILQNEEKLFQASYPNAMHGVLGNLSLLIVSGDLHSKLRNVVVGFTSASKSSPTFLNYVEKLAVSMLESWRDCKEVALHPEVKKFTLKLMVKSILSIEPDEPLALKILQDFQTYMKGFVSLPLNLPGSHYAKAVKARRRLAWTVKEIIEERGNKEKCKDEKGGDFLDVILSKGRLSHEEIVSVVLDMLLGGYETTSILIALILYFLAHSPTAFQHLKLEHEAIRRCKEEGKPLNLDDYQKMKFTHNVINEAMRCGNIVKFVHRKALQDVKFKDYVIPAGWKILPVLSAIHLDPNLHENPTDFNPWRWNDKSTMKKVMPFGGGPRLCPGAELAKVEIAFFLHHLVLTYRWRLKGNDFPIAYPYVEFSQGLLLEIQPTEAMMAVEKKEFI